MDFIPTKFKDIHNEMTYDEREDEKNKFYVGLRHILEVLGASEFNSNKISTITTEAYDTGDVFYHTFYHVNLLLDFAKKNQINLTETEKLAIYFHDVIYTPGFKNNEENSDLFMRSMIEGHIDEHIVATASDIILDTANHLLVGSCHSDVVMDLDLHGFANPYDDFLRQNVAIDREFGKNPKKDLDYALGRISFLELLIGRDKIYRTKYFQHICESAARENIGRYLKELKALHND